MPRGSWRWGVVAGVAWGCLVGSAAAQDRAPATLPPVPPPATSLPGPAATAPPAALPPAADPHAADHPPVKDLTPPGFASDLPAHGGHGGGHENAHLAPFAPEDGGFYSSAEFLLLRARRTAFDYAIPNPSGALGVTGPVYSLNYELRGGLRTEVGYRFANTGWDVAFGYTYYRTAADAVARTGPGQALLPTLTRPGLTDQAAFAAADANLEYNVFDLVAGRRFVLDEYFAFRTFGGLRFASIHQDLVVNYDGLDARQARVNAGTSFEGFGPIAGGEAVLTGLYGCHLYARASGGMLTGPARNPILETNDGGRTTYANTAYNVRKVVPVASVGVGAGWQYRTVWVRAGYEITNYFGLIDQPRFVDDVGIGKVVTRSSNLSLEGLFFQVGWVY